MIVDRTFGAPCRYLVRLFHARGERGVLNNPSIWILVCDQIGVEEAVQSVLRELRIVGLHMDMMPMRISDAGEVA